VPNTVHSQVAHIVDHLQKAPSPLTAKQLQKALGTLHKITEGEVTAGLTEAGRLGQAYPWAGRSPRYWHCDEKAFIQERLLEIAGVEALSAKELVARASRISKGCTQAAVEKEFKALKQARQIVGKKIFGPSVLYYIDGSPGALVKGSIRVLRDKLRKSGLTEAQIESELKGIAQAPVSSSPVEAPASRKDLGASIADALRQLEPAHGAPVTVHRLRSAIPEADKRAFDEAVLKLADQQVLSLTRHDNGWALPKEEREELIFDGGDALYVAVAFRI